MSVCLCTIQPILHSCICPLYNPKGGVESREKHDNYVGFFEVYKPLFLDLVYIFLDKLVLYMLAFTLKMLTMQKCN